VAIKGIGTATVQAIIRARKEGGAFTSLYDFTDRVDQKGVNRRVLESLIKSGACDSLSPNRAALLTVIDKAMELGVKSQRDRDAGQFGLFGGDGAQAEIRELPLPDVTSWSRKETLLYEKETLGFYASGHPLEDYVSILDGVVNADSGSVTEKEHADQVVMGGIVIDPTIRLTKKGDRFALFRLEDQFGAVKVVCWPEAFSKYKTLIQADCAVLVKGRLELSDDGAASIIVQEIHPLEGARARSARSMIIQLPTQSITDSRLSHLEQAGSRDDHGIPVSFEVSTTDKLKVVIRPNHFFRLKNTQNLTSEIAQVCQDWSVDFVI
jgi:DNA polymerase-3 subunit alpha